MNTVKNSQVAIVTGASRGIGAAVARRLASEAGIDLSHLRGTGPHGRIVARDIEDAPRPSRALAAVEGPGAAEIKALFDSDSYEEVPLDGMRRTIATRLVQAKQTIPHFYLTADVEIGRLLALREDESGFATVGNLVFAGAPWRLRRRLPLPAREALDEARRMACRN